MKKVAVIFNGGTITMKVDEKLKAAVPSLTGEQIMKMVTGIEDFASIEVHTFSSLPGPHVTPSTMLSLSKFIEEIIKRDDIDGIVVTHGTDTLEETAYLVDLTINTNKPIVFTGSMRSGSELGYDGPSNLAASICTAASNEARGRGVLVCLNGYLHIASDVTKTNSMSLDSFKTPNFGPIGMVDSNMALFYRENIKNESFSIERLETKVSLIRCTAGQDSGFLNYSIDNGEKGIVIEGFGRGNIPTSMIDGVKRAVDNNIPIIIVSRCFEGRVEPTYGYEGGGKQLYDMGVIFGDMMQGQKARIKLMVALSSGLSIKEIRDLFQNK